MDTVEMYIEDAKYCDQKMLMLKVNGQEIVRQFLNRQTEAVLREWLDNDLQDRYANAMIELAAIRKELRSSEKARQQGWDEANKLRHTVKQQAETLKVQALELGRKKEEDILTKREAMLYRESGRLLDLIRDIYQLFILDRYKHKDLLKRVEAALGIEIER